MHVKDSAFPAEIRPIGSSIHFSSLKKKKGGGREEYSYQPNSSAARSGRERGTCVRVCVRVRAR